MNKLKNRDINLCHSDYQSSSSSTVLPYLLLYRKRIDTSCCIYLQSTYSHYFVYIELPIDHFSPYKMMGWTKKWFVSPWCMEYYFSFSQITLIVIVVQRPHGLQHTRLLWPSISPGVCSDSCPLSQWCYLTILSCLPLFLLPSVFLSIRVFSSELALPSDGQSIEASASASVLPMNIQDWFPLGWTGWMSLQSKGLSRVFSRTTIQNHHFFSAQLFLWSNSHIHTWLLEKP